MSKFVNRLILIDTLVRDNCYHSTPKLIKDYFGIEDIDKSLSKISSNRDELMKNKRICYFLCKQNENLVDYLKEEILKDKNSYLRYLSDKKLLEYLSFENLDEIKLFNKAIKTNICSKSENFVYAFRDGLSFEKASYAIDFFEKNDLDGDYKCYGAYIHDYELKDFIGNSFVWDFSDTDILNIIKNCNEFGLEFKCLNKDKLNIMKNHNSIYIYMVNQENLDLIDRITSIISNGPEDKDDDNTFYGYGYLGERLKRKLYELMEGIHSYIDVITDKYDEKETQKNLIYSMLSAIEYDFISSLDDMKLLVNKIKYDFKPENSEEIGFDMLGLSLETYNNLDIKPYDVALLIRFKNSLPKGFFRKIIGSADLTKCILHVDNSLLSLISTMLELGQLNEEQIKCLANLIRSNIASVLNFTKDFTGLEYKLSYDEFMYVYENKRYVSLSVVNSLKGMKQSARLLKLKSMVEINKTLRNKEFSVDFNMIESYISDKDIPSLMKKDNPLNIKDMGDYIEYKAIDSMVPVNSIEYLNKIKFLLKNDFSLLELTDLSCEDIDSKVWSSSKLISFMNKMNLSDAFKEEYKDNIINFLSSEEYDLVNSYYKNSYSSRTQKKGIMLIGKSIIANKYDELKFVREDIRKEISMDISDEAFEAWKRTDVVSNGAYEVQDSSDFKYIMKMGELPVRSCMNYVNGMYSHCLLSNFDTSKKMILIHKNGKYVGRAILRLTVMSDEDTINSSLEFVDVDNNLKESSNKSSNELIIFLEKVYTTLDSEDLKECYPMIVELLKGKAKEMGAKLVASYNYNKYIGDDCSNESKYVFITASKNGSQYLDSFDGSTSSSYCYKRASVYIY